MPFGIFVMESTPVLFVAYKRTHLYPAVLFCYQIPSKLYAKDWPVATWHGLLSVVSFGKPKYQLS